MLKLVFYVHNRLLRVREAIASDSFAKSCTWKNRIEFIVSDSSDFTMVWTSLLPDLEPQNAEALLDLVSARYPISPNYPELNKNCPEMVFHNDTDEWIFFGGSFNPWHKGHQACLDLLDENKTCFITPDRNPLKELHSFHPVFDILEISTKAKFKKNQFLVPTFLLEHKKNPTVEWVTRLKENFPALKVSLLMGFDSFNHLKNWIRSEELIPLIDTAYVASRLEDDDERSLALNEVHARGPELNVVFLGRHKFEDLSSTEMRERDKN